MSSSALPFLGNRSWLNLRAVVVILSLLFLFLNLEVLTSFYVESLPHSLIRSSFSESLKPRKRSFLNVSKSGAIPKSSESAGIDQSRFAFVHRLEKKDVKPAPSISKIPLSTQHRGELNHYMEEWKVTGKGGEVKRREQEEEFIQIIYGLKSKKENLNSTFIANSSQNLSYLNKNTKNAYPKQTYFPSSEVNLSTSFGESVNNLSRNTSSTRTNSTFRPNFTPYLKTIFKHFATELMNKKNSNNIKETTTNFESFKNKKPKNSILKTASPVLEVVKSRYTIYHKNTNDIYCNRNRTPNSSLQTDVLWICEYFAAKFISSRLISIGRNASASKERQVLEANKNKTINESLLLRYLRGRNEQHNYNHFQNNSAGTPHSNQHYQSPDFRIKIRQGGKEVKALIPGRLYSGKSIKKVYRNIYLYVIMT